MRRIYLAVALAGAVMLALAGSAFADGTETLGPPSVPVATGTGLTVAGAGTQAFPNVDRTFSVNVPAGATVKQVLLYWEGHWTDHAPHFSNVPQVDGDNVISINGNAVVGTKIGGSTAFFTQFAGAVAGTEKFVSYRADITGLGLVAAGANSLTVGNMSFGSNFPTGFPFNQGNDGAGVVVIYDDGTDSTVVGLRDGLDLAYANFAAPLNTTVAQTLTFDPSAAARSASLSTLAGSVRGPDLDGFRGTTLRVSFSTGATFDIQDPWQSAQGAEFDAFTQAITIPADATSMTVQALSGPSERPASLAWIAASLTITNPPSNGGGEGCTPGYWKNHDGSKKQGDAWPPTGFSQTQLLSSVFSPTGLGTLGSFTLRQALEFGGGSTLEAKKQNLLRIGVASLLNAAHPDVSFPLTTAQVIAQINAALVSNDATTIENLQRTLDILNNAGCPLGNS